MSNSIDQLQIPAEKKKIRRSEIAIMQWQNWKRKFEIPKVIVNYADVEIVVLKYINTYLFKYLKSYLKSHYFYKNLYVGKDDR